MDVFISCYPPVIGGGGCCLSSGAPWLDLISSSLWMFLLVIGFEYSPCFWIRRIFFILRAWFPTRPVSQWKDLSWGLNFLEGPLIAFHLFMFLTHFKKSTNKTISLFLVFIQLKTSWGTPLPPPWGGLLSVGEVSPNGKIDKAMCTRLKAHGFTYFSI